jgi:hypothetical protein
MFVIPRVKDKIQLTKEWKFYLNRVLVTLEEGTIISIEKIEEKKIASYKYLSYIRLKIPKRGNKNKPYAGEQFDFSLSEVYDMEFISLNQKIVDFKRDILITLKSMDKPIDGWLFSEFIASLDALTDCDTFSNDILDIVDEFGSKIYRWDNNDIDNLVIVIKQFVRKHKIAQIDL